MNLAQSNTLRCLNSGHSEKLRFSNNVARHFEKCEIIGLLSLPAAPDQARSTGAAVAPGARRFSAV